MTRFNQEKYDAELKKPKISKQYQPKAQVELMLSYGIVRIG